MSPSVRPPKGPKTTRPRKARRLWQRAFDGLGLGTIGIVIAYALCSTLGHHLSWTPLAYRGDWFGKWLAFDFMSILLVATGAALILVPTLNLAPTRTVPRIIVLVSMAGVATVVLALVRIISMLPVELYYPQDHLLDRYIPRLVMQYSVFVFLAVVAAELFRRETINIEAAHQADLDRSTLEGALLAARLQVLRAQVEPHFLFNTLGTVRRLYDTEPAAGRAMLENLMRYLEIALPHMKAEMSQLQDELALARAFLNVQKVRMGDRLAFSIDFPLNLAPVTLPSMMVLTLVENAVKHGLAPLRAGGAVHVEAGLRGDQRLVVTVSDTGRGFGASAPHGIGTGIANLRARLSAMYGDGASVAFASAEPQGAIATLSIPIVESPAQIA
jgi:LytS/YehU family sensor histidine kinase